MLLRPTSPGARRRGVSLVLITVSLVALLGVLAVSLEGGLLLSERRTAQATADAAAEAAAADLYWYWFVNYGKDPGGTAKTAALNTASYNGYTNDGTNTIVTVNIPPQSGDHVGQDGYVEVITEYYHTRGFSSLFGVDKVPVRGRAVAVGKSGAAEVGIMVLDPSSKNALNANGGGSITVQKVSVINDSSDPSGTTVGGGSTITAPHYYLVGNYTTGGGGALYGPVNTGVRSVPDPLAYVPAPDPNTLTQQSKKKTQYTSGSYTLYPGVYTGGINASSTAGITLMPGIYYMDGGGFNFTGNGSLTGSGVMIYNAPTNGNSGGINISANGAVNLSAPTSGIYQGLLFFQARTAPDTANVSGGSNMNLTGTFYFPNALLSVTGSAGFDNFGSQYISKDLNVQGTGSIYINWDPKKAAQTRLIALVE